MSDRFTGEDLTCIRGERVVFAGLSFALASGDALVLRGRNGSGKSSLLRLMAGLLRPAQGMLRWNGSPAAADRGAHNARIIYIGHQDALKPALTAAENLAFAAGLRGWTGDPRKALDRVGLAPLAYLPVRFLSAGERRRLALARLAATEAPLWLLDEPMAGLDDSAVDGIHALVAGHRANGGMVVSSAHGPHGLDEADELDLGDFAVTRPDDSWTVSA